MTRPRARKLIDCSMEPIGLSVEDAATFIGVSETLFHSAVASGSMPPPRQLAGRLIWDVEEMIVLRRLPRKGATPEQHDSPERWRPRA